MCYACAWEGWPRKKGYLNWLKLITKLHFHFLLHLFIKKFKIPFHTGKSVGMNLYILTVLCCSTFSQLPLPSIGLVSLFSPTIHSRANPPENIRNQAYQLYTWSLIRNQRAPIWTYTREGVWRLIYFLSFHVCIPDYVVWLAGAPWDFALYISCIWPKHDKSTDQQSYSKKYTLSPWKQSNPNTFSNNKASLGFVGK